MKRDEAWADYSRSEEFVSFQRAVQYQVGLLCEVERVFHSAWTLADAAAKAEALRVLEPYLRDEGSHKVSEIAEEIKRRIEGMK